MKDAMKEGQAPETVEVMDAEEWRGNSLPVPKHQGIANLVPGGKPRRIRLSNLNHVADELARVYRGMRSGEIPPENGSRYSYVLQTLAKVLEAAEFEKRISALEKRQ
jgi:hypothetical protein